MLKVVFQKIKESPTRKKVEAVVLLLSVSAVVVSYFLQGGEDRTPLSLVTSLCGVVSVFFVAKGMILGQWLGLIYSLFYTLLSYFNRYYGECIITICTMLPSCIISIVTWLNHPAKESGKVKINRISKKEFFLMGLTVVLLSQGAYFLLKALGTASLSVSTVSVTTSLAAAYLLIRRSKYYALFYLLNDVVLIVLWSIAFFGGESVLPCVISFFGFLISDSYGLYEWNRRLKEQEKEDLSKEENL